MLGGPPGLASLLAVAGREGWKEEGGEPSPPPLWAE